VAQSVEQFTLDFGSGRDLRVLEWSPCQALHSAESLLEDSLPIPLPFPLLSLSLTLCLSQIN